MKKLIAKSAFFVNDRMSGLRVGQYLTTYSHLLNSGRDQVETYQIAKLKKLLIFAYEKVPFYKSRMDDSGFDPNRFKYLDDIDKLPPLTREDLQENQKALSSSKDTARFKQGSSSGSTGQPVIYYHDQHSLSAGVAAQYLGWGFSGWKFGMKGLHIWGNPRVVNVEWKRLSSRLKAKLYRHHKFPAYELTENNNYKKLADILSKEKYDFIDGYTNAIYLFAKYVKEQELKVPRLAYIFTTGENLQDFQRAVIEEVLGPVYDGYGCGEIKGIAYQDSKADSYYIIDTHVVVRFNKDVKGEDGSRALLITDLDNYAMPLINYQNNDLGIEEKLHSNGLPLTRLSRISGRISDIIDLPSGGNLVVPSFFGSMLLKQVTGIKNYQVEKVQKDKIIIKLVTTKSFSTSDSEKVKSSLREYLKDKIKWEIEYVDSIAVEKNGKFKLLIDKTSVR